MRVVPRQGWDAVGLDLIDTPFTSMTGSIADRDLVRQALEGVDVVFHTATLHKPHIDTHSRQDFVDTNVTGTLNLLEESAAARVQSFIFTSTTSAFGRALTPPPGQPAAWITEAVQSVPRNIYGVTKTSAEDICELVHRSLGLPCVILRTSRFFPEADDRPDMREAYDDANLKVNELLNRRVDIDDVVCAHLLAAERAPALGFGRYIVTATTPFTPAHLAELRSDAASVVRRLFPDAAEIYAGLGWRLPESVERVYVNANARRDLDWAPRYDFRFALHRLATGQEHRSSLALAVGAKGYHSETAYPYTAR